MQDIAFIVAGLVVGLVVGMTGVGGGSLMTPLLIFGFGVKPYLAIGTDLLFAAFTKLGGSIGLVRARRIDWPVVGALCLGSIPAALLTVAALRHFGPSSPEVQRVMTSTLGVALLLTAAATLYKALRGPRKAAQASPLAAPTARTGGRTDALSDTRTSTLTDTQNAQACQPRHPALPVLLGALIGVLVSISSVGAGAIGVTALMLLYPALPLPRIVAADIAYAVPVTLVAGLGHASLGSVNGSMLALLLTGSLPGIWLGSRLIFKVPERVVRAMLSALLAYAGLKLFAI